MKNATRALARPRATSRNNVAFDRLQRRSGIVVSLVLVPPHADGKAWGHTDDGTCVEFTQSRETMLRLFHQLRAAGRVSPPATVTVDGPEWQVVPIERVDCPIHTLPPITEGTAIAFAPY